MNKPPPLRILVLGPANSGKSTFVGDSLHKYGHLEPEMTEKLRKQEEEEEEGKSSGQLLAALHGLESEASSGRRYYKSPRYEVAIVNPTSHAQNFVSFFPNGEQAACVMLLVSATEGKFEADWRLIQNQVCFVCNLPLKHIVVLVNKMDTTEPAYCYQRYEGICEKILKSFKTFLRGPHTLVFSPISAVGKDKLQGQLERNLSWCFRNYEFMSTGPTGAKTNLLDFLDSISSCESQQEPTKTCSDLDSDAEGEDLTPLDLRVSCPSPQPLDLTKHPGPSSGSRDDHLELPLTRQERRPGEEAAWRAGEQPWAGEGEAPGAGRGAWLEKRRLGLVQADAAWPGFVSQPAQSLARRAPSALLPSSAAPCSLQEAQVQQGSQRPEGPPSSLVLEQGLPEPSPPTQLDFLQPPQQPQQPLASVPSLPTRWPLQATHGQRQRRPRHSDFSSSSAPRRAQPLQLVSQPLPSVSPRRQPWQDQARPFPGAPSSAALGHFPSAVWVAGGPPGSRASSHPMRLPFWLLPAQVVPRSPGPMPPPPRSPPPAAP